MVHEIDIIFDTKAVRIRQKGQNGKVYGIGFEPAGVELIQTLVDYLKNEHNLLVGRLYADGIFQILGSAVAPETARFMVVKGRDLTNGMPGSRQISSDEIYQITGKIIDRIIDLVEWNIVHVVLRWAEMNSLQECQLTLKGEFKNLPGLKQRLQEVLKCDITVDPSDDSPL